MARHRANRRRSDPSDSATACLPRRNHRLIVALAGLVAACPAASASEVANLAYGPDRQQVLDLHLPDQAGRPAPVVVFFHGGAFVGGDKHPCAPHLAALLTARGIAFACANYRLAPRVHYPAPMRDGARAVQWLRAHATDYGLDPQHFAVMGMSAGAGIALWIAFRPDLADAGSPDPILRQSTGVSAVVTGNAQATYDPAEIEARLHTRRFPKFLAQFFGAISVQGLGEARYRQAEQDASPIANMHAGEPPLLAYYAAAAAPLASDSAPQVYIHHPEQGRVLETVGHERGAEVTLRDVTDYPQGWQGFLEAATDFLAGSLER
jgi:acetyl esterase